MVGSICDKEATIKGTILPGTNKVAAFHQRINSFKRIYISDPSAIDNQRNYLQRVRKHDRYTVTQFLDRLKHINMVLIQSPSAIAADSFSSTELKKFFITLCLPVGEQTSLIWVRV